MVEQLELLNGESVFSRIRSYIYQGLEDLDKERQAHQGIKNTPLKLVKQRAVTVNKRRAQEVAEQEGMNQIMQGLCYAEQTELVGNAVNCCVTYSSSSFNALPSLSEMYSFSCKVESKL